MAIRSNGWCLPHVTFRWQRTRYRSDYLRHLEAWINEDKGGAQCKNNFPGGTNNRSFRGTSPLEAINPYQTASPDPNPYHDTILIPARRTRTRDSANIPLGGSINISLTPPQKNPPVLANGWTPWYSSCKKIIHLESAFKCSCNGGIVRFTGRTIHTAPDSSMHRSGNSTWNINFLGYQAICDDMFWIQ